MIINIETSCSQGFISAFVEKSVLFHEPIEQKTSHYLMQEIQSLLQKHSFDWKDISLISVGLGPGLFLGTRIGVIIAKTLAYGLDIPLLGYCSLTLVTPENNGPFFVLSDAKSKGVNTLKGFKDNHKISFEKLPVLYSVDEFATLHQKEPLLTSDPELLTKALPFHNSLQLTSIDINHHRKEILKKRDSTTLKDPVNENLEIHYLRLS